jgi:hypothetical protein
MGAVFSFAESKKYFASLKPAPLRAILDTNILASLTYEVKSDHEVVSYLISELSALGVEFFATVNTKQEFLDFHRRVILTENLIDIADAGSKVNIPKSAKLEIQSANASMKSKTAKSGGDPIFNDTQIKKIKAEFSAGNHSGHLGWLKFCEAYLNPKLSMIEDGLEEIAVTYLSPNEPAQASYFTAKLEWKEAVAMTKLAGQSMTDSMILNCLKNSICQVVITTDFDMGFAMLADKSLNKVAIVPDEMSKEFKHYHFNS